MNKRFLLAWLVLFIVWFFGSFLNHGVLLHNDYMQLRSLFRTEQESQAFFPRYGFSSQNGAEALLGPGDVRPEQFRGSMGIGWWPILASSRP